MNPDKLSLSVFLSFAGFGTETHISALFWIINRTVVILMLILKHIVCHFNRNPYEPVFLCTLPVSDRTEGRYGDNDAHAAGKVNNL